jgi:hypothetical protein
MRVNRGLHKRSRAGSLVPVRQKPEKKPVNKPVLVAALTVHLVAVTVTWRDISIRPADRIRGSKTGWRIASALNTLGSVGYWLVGRR